MRVENSCITEALYTFQLLFSCLSNVTPIALEIDKFFTGAPGINVGDFSTF